MKSSAAVCVLVLAMMHSISAQNTNATRGEPAHCHELALSPGAEQAASEIGVLEHVQRLRTVRSAACASGASVSLEELALRQHITDAVTVASLDVDGVVSQIDYERAQILETRVMLSNRKDRTINLLSLANIFAGTGSGILSNAMQFSDKTAYAGDGVGIAGGGAGVILSILGLRVQGGKAAIGIAPNMLAQIFGRQPETHSTYPPSVWTYLNTTPAPYPRIQTPWREELIKQWIGQKRIGPPDAPASQKKIQLLTSSIAEHTRLPIDVLADRSMMLLEVRSRVTLMKGALRDLLSAVVKAE